MNVSKSWTGSSPNSSHSCHTKCSRLSGPNVPNAVEWMEDGRPVLNETGTLMFDIVVEQIGRLGGPVYELFNVSRIEADIIHAFHIIGMDLDVTRSSSIGATRVF